MTTNSLPSKFLRISCTALLLFFGLLPATLTGQVTWDGGGANSSWGTAENWSGDTLPVNGNALVFDGSTQTSNVNDELTSIGNLTFASTASAFTLSGNAITLGGNILNSSTTNVQTINLDMATSAVRTITLTGIYSVSEPSTSGVTLGGDISGTGGIDVATGTISFGSGTVTVLGNNSFEGGFTFRGNDSTRKLLNLGHANALGTGLFTWSANNNSNTLNTLDNISGSTMTIANNLLLAGSRGRMTFVGTNDFIFEGTVTNSQDTSPFGRLIEVNAGNVTFQGNIFLSDLVGTGRGLTFGGAGSSTVTGIISNYNGVGGTAGKVTVGGTSKLVGTTTLELLNPSNTYTGSTSMGATDASSTLIVTKLSDGGEVSSIGASSNDAANLVVNGVRADATLRYIGSGDSTDRLFTISSDGSVLKIESSGTGALHFTNTGDIVIPGVSGSGRTLELGGTYTGGVNSLRPNVTGSQALLSKVGPGTWVLSGNNTYGQVTTVSGGILTLNRQTGSIAAASPLTMRGGTFNMDNTGASGALTQNLGALTFSAGDSSVQTTRTAAQDQALTFSSIEARAVGATGNFVNGGGTNSTTNGFNLTGRGAGYITQGTFYGGSAYAWMDGAGTFVRAISYGSDTGAVTSGAAVTLPNAVHQQITGAISAQTNANFTTLNIAGNHNFTLQSSANVIRATGILKSGNTAGGATISGGSIRSRDDNNEFVIRTDGINDALTISSSIVAAGTNALTKSGAGTLTLSGTNTYTGQTYVNGGTLSIGANINLGAEATGAALNLNNGTLQATGTFGLYNGSPDTNSRAVVLANVGGFDVTSGNTLTVAGVVSDLSNVRGSLLKTNDGTLTLSANNTYTGTTTISGGTIQLGAGGTTGSLSANSAITNNGTLRFNRSDTMTQGTDFSKDGIGGSGAFEQNGTGTVIFNATNEYTGATTVNAGTLLVSGTGSLNSSSSVTIHTGGNFSYSSSTGLTQNVTLNSGGTFSHTGSSSYTGDLTWNGGTLTGTNFTGVNLSVGAGKTLSPGNSPGTMTSGSQTWTDGGNYNLQIYDATGLAGTGFDTLEITGTLDLTGLGAGEFNINLWSLSSISPDTNGNAINFDNLTSNTWLIASTTGGIVGFNDVATQFTVYTAANNGTGGFSNALAGGNFSITRDGNNLYLSFDAIPEPNTAMLLGVGLASLLLRRRRVK